jgi:hypothetical protein
MGTLIVSFGTPISTHAIFPRSNRPFAVHVHVLLTSYAVALQFASLIDLDLSNNELTLLPLGIGYLPQLRRIDVSNNKVRACTCGFKLVHVDTT